MPARPIIDSGRAPWRLGEAPDLGEDVPGGGAGGVEALRLGRAGGQRGGVLGGARELDADRVVGLARRPRPRGEDARRSRRASSSSVGGGDEPGALGDHLARVRGAADARRRAAAPRASRRARPSARCPSGGTRPLASETTAARGGRGRRAASAGDHLVEPPRGHAEEHESARARPAPVGSMRSSRGQLDAGQVDAFSRSARRRSRLLGGARLQRRAQAAAREQHGDRRAERAGADDDGAPGGRARGDCGRGARASPQVPAAAAGGDRHDGSAKAALVAVPPRAPRPPPRPRRASSPRERVCRSSIRCSKGPSPSSTDDRVAGHAGLAARVADLAGDLALQRRAGRAGPRR